MKTFKYLIILLAFFLISIVPVHAEETIAYAEYNPDNGHFRIFRDVAGAYENETVINDKTYFADIEDVSNDFKWQNFNDKRNVTKVIIEDNIAPSDGHSMFYNFSSMTEIQGLEKLNTSNMTSLASMFANCSSLEQSLDLTTFDTSNVTTIVSMFAGSAVPSVDFSGWNVQNLTNISYLFNNNTSIKNVDFSTWDNPNISRLERCFYSCANLETVDVSTLNTRNATNMSMTFYKCTSLKSLDLSNWNIENVTNLNQIFSNCSSLKTIDVSTWTGDNVTDTQSMFSTCRSLKKN